MAAAATWAQAYTPLHHSLGSSAAVAAIPLVVVFVWLALLRVQAYKTVLLALATALGLCVFVWGMPAKLAGLAALQGAAFGLFPVFHIVLATLFLYNITVESGQFEIIRSSLAGVTVDRRLQALLIAFSFGAFIEGAAGFGTPVAIAGAMLVGLGFRPVYAARVCLLANTAPVAFGAIGIPIVALGGVMGLNDAGLMRLSTMVGRQLPFISFFIPLYLIVVMVGWKRSFEVLPAILVCGGSFAVCQWATASFLGPYLPDILSSLASLVCLLLLLKVWRPKTFYRFADEPEFRPADWRLTRGEVVHAWAPYAVLTAMVLLWGLPRVKAALDASTVQFSIAGLDQAITEDRGAISGPGIAVPGSSLPAVSPGAHRLPARFKFDYLASAGSAIFLAALISAALGRIGLRSTGRLFGKTLRDMRFAGITIASVMALAYVMNASGMTTCLGLWFTKAGRLFPFIAPCLGWLGVLLTGSDTSSNVLFGGLQKAAAQRLGLDPVLTAAANTSGGVMGKMISPQSLVVACAATGIVGEEASLFRFTLRHSMILLALVGMIVYLQAYYFTWMIPR